jgi:hypothetical protein
MSVLDRVASSLGQRGGKPNHVLAEELARNPDPDAITELAEATGSRPARMASDCLEVLEEIAKIKPELIAPHVDTLLALCFRARTTAWCGAPWALWLPLPI